MGQTFLNMLENTGLVSGILLGLGLILLLVEVFIPGFGICGISGLFFLICGGISRYYEGISLPEFMVLVLAIAGVVLVAFLVLILLIKCHLIQNNGIFETGTALPKDYNLMSKEYKKLVGKIGRTTTELNLGGRVKVRGKVYEALANHNFIGKGKLVKVVKVASSYIIVEKLWE